MLFEKIEKVASEAARVGIRTLGQRNSNSAAKSDRTSSFGGKKSKVTFFRGPRSASWPVPKVRKFEKFLRKILVFIFSKFFSYVFRLISATPGQKFKKVFEPKKIFFPWSHMHLLSGTKNTNGRDVILKKLQ